VTLKIDGCFAPSILHRFKAHLCQNDALRASFQINEITIFGNWYVFNMSHLYCNIASLYKHTQGFRSNGGSIDYKYHHIDQAQIARIIKQPAEMIKRPVKMIKQPAEMIKQPAKVVKRLVKMIKRLVKMIKRPA
jgi:hypothetical protein